MNLMITCLFLLTYKISLFKMLNDLYLKERQKMK